MDLNTNSVFMLSKIIYKQRVGILCNKNCSKLPISFLQPKKQIISTKGLLFGHLQIRIMDFNVRVMFC